MIKICLIDNCNRPSVCRGWCTLHYQRWKKHRDPLKSEHHGHTGKGKKTPEYQSWNDMIQRCCNPKHKHYKSYGGRGIKVSGRWRHSFPTFLDDMGFRPTDKHTLERINNSLGYSPENCKWETRSRQSRNTRRNHLLTVNGETLCISDWADKISLPHWLIRNRLKQGKTPEEALFTLHIPRGPYKPRRQLNV